MATPSSFEKKTMLLGVLTAALAASAVCARSGPPAAPTFTIENPTKTAVHVVMGNLNVQVDNGVTTIQMMSPEQDVKIQTSEGQVMELHVQDGDVVRMQPDDDCSNQSFSFVVNPSGDLSFPPMKPGIPSPPSPSR